MINEKIRARGTLKMVLRGPDGRAKAEHDLKNLVVTTGLAFIASRMLGTTDAVMSHMAIGTGAVAPSLANTTLGGEAGRVALGSAGSAGPVVTYTATFPPGTGTGAITEAGIFNAAAAGTMLNRVSFPVVNKAAGDTLSIAWTVTLS